MNTMTVNGKAYQIVRLLGKGKGGYSYQVTDGINQYTLKQIHHEPCNYYQFGNKLESELKDYETLKQVGIRMPVLYEVDENHERLLKEYVDGPTVMELVESHLMKDDYIQQMMQMCTLLYQNHLNIDYYPTNFIVRNDVLVYIDYECNEYSDQWNFENW
ncbi:MAG: hypothetical protein IKY14_00245, partial [Erysipelotrichaceae bacterium]|nr:hypothetical protein [Erysipelotrichaceae bacterium]